MTAPFRFFQTKQDAADNTAQGKLDEAIVHALVTRAVQTLAPLMKAGGILVDTLEKKEGTPRENINNLKEILAHTSSAHQTVLRLQEICEMGERQDDAESASIKA